MKHLLLIVLTALLVAGCSLGAVEGLVVSQYAGTYKGTWTNTVTGATGAGSVIVALNADKRTATLTLDFDGNYLGLNDPPPITMVGTYDTNGAVVRGKDPIMGSYDITIDRKGNIVGLLKGLNNGAIPEMSYTGTVSRDKIATDYVVKFADGREAKSIFRATKAK